MTGGAGLIGSTTIDLLLRSYDPRRIVIFDNLSRGSTSNLTAALEDPRVVLTEGDIRDRDGVARVVTGADAVVYLAALREALV